MLRHQVSFALALLTLGLSAGLQAASPAAVTQTAQKITLQSAGAEYIFSAKAPFHMLSSSLHGKPLFVKKFSFTYMLKNRTWCGDNMGGSLLSRYTMEVKKVPGAVQLICKIQGNQGGFTKVFTLRDGSPNLEVTGVMELLGKLNPLNWFNMFSIPLPIDHKFMFLLSREKNGQVTPELQIGNNPFVDAQGKIFTHGNFEFNVIREMFAAGSWNPETQVGALILSKPGCYMWPIRAYASLDGKQAGLSMSPTAFYRTTRPSAKVEGALVVVPFEGNPEQLNKKIVPEYIPELVKRNLIPSHFDTGFRIADNADFELWQELPETKVFRTTKAPRQVKKTVELFACRDEGESFTLALRPKKELKNVSLRVMGFSKFDIKTLWNPIGFIERSKYLGYLTAITGNVPDALLNQKVIDLKAGETQPFLVGFRVPRDQKPGLYTGTVEVLEGEKVLAAIPVKLRVWDFSIADNTLTCAFDFWRRPKTYPDKEGAYAESEKLIVDARGGKRWVQNVKLRYDKDNNLLPIDYREFDQSVEHALKVYRHKFIIVHMYCLGWGMERRSTWFGPKDSVLTPVWNKRVINFTRDLRRHMIEKGWNDYVVIDLFDEPKDKDLWVLAGTIKLIKSVAPEWRFTFAGDYRKVLDGLIDFWGHGMSRYTPETQLIIQPGKNEMSLYNPNGYSDNEANTYQRGSYIWLWRHNIRYLYQWVTNCWADLGNRGWDYYRCASWIVPGKNGPEGSLRLEATRNGIEDYEYLSQLKKVVKKYAKNNPAQAQQAQKLINSGLALAWMPAGGEIPVVVNLNPAAFAKWHYEAGKFLDQAAK